jgi:O-antigen ligase
MRYLFFILFVALFLPNLGFGGRTVYGTVQLADFIIVPYAVVAFLLSGNDKREQLVDRIVPLMLAFVVWALIGTALIRWRFAYNDYEATYFGLLKLGKFVLYGGAGVLTAKALRDRWIRQRFDWALLAAGCFLSAGRFTTSDRWGGPALGEALEGYQSNDAISVAIGILGCYLVGEYLFGTGGSTRWRRVTPPVLLFMVLGQAAAHGRSGMLAGLAGLGYVVWRKGINGRTAWIVMAATTALVASYFLLSSFRLEVDETLWPDPAHQAQYHGVMVIDDGARIYTWAHEAPKFLDYPLFGTGFFHRGGHSGLWGTGAHNFFIEVSLETGLVGGLLFLAILWGMWKQASAPPVERGGCGTALKAAIIATVVGGMGEAYFYGGMALFSLLAVYARCGAFAISPDSRRYRAALAVPSTRRRVRTVRYPDVYSGQSVRDPSGVHR